MESNLKRCFILIKFKGSKILLYHIMLALRQTTKSTCT